MQGKEASEQETRKCTAGIDVSKNGLDAHVLAAAASLHVANTSEGIRQLKRWLHRAQGRARRGRSHGQVASPGLSKPFGFSDRRCDYQSLSGAHVRKSAGHPCQDRPARRQGVGHVCGHDVACRAGRRHRKCFEAMQELVTARSSAVAEDVALKNQLATACGSLSQASAGAAHQAACRSCQSARERVPELVQADEALARRFAILTSIPGIGAIVAVTLLACLAELGSLSDKQIGALGGLAPVADDFGTA